MTRRFIAGAVCPRCGQMDKLVVDSEAGLRECVSCGFKDQRPQDPLAKGIAGAVTEPTTRVNRPAARLLDTPAETVRLLEPDQSKKD
jgi:uncharacterized metal-binding protein (TIGR02443 family)